MEIDEISDGGSSSSVSAASDDYEEINDGKVGV